MVPNEFHNIGARSGTTSRFLLSSSKAVSRVSGEESSTILQMTIHIFLRLCSELRCICQYSGSLDYFTGIKLAFVVT